MGNHTIEETQNKPEEGKPVAWRWRRKNPLRSAWSYSEIRPDDHPDYLIVPLYEKSDSRK